IHTDGVQPPPPPPGGDAKLFFGDITELTGTSLTIASIDAANGPPSGGESHTFSINDHTMWMLANGQLGSAADFHVGDMVGVKAALTPDGTWVALGVMQQGTQPPPPPDDERMFTGSITALGDGHLTL